MLGASQKTKHNNIIHIINGGIGMLITERGGRTFFEEPIRSLFDECNLRCDDHRL